MKSREIWLVRNVTRGTVVGNYVERAETSAERRKGLLGRTELAAGAGLLIAPCESVHSFGMKFAIDVVYLGKDWVVKKIRRGMKPWRISLCLQAWAVLELPVAGADGIQVGDRLEMVQST
jgi:uncharacterized protein